MKTQIDIHNCEQLYCVLHAPSLNKEVEDLAQKISFLDTNESLALNGWDGDYVQKVSIQDVHRIFSQDKKVYFETEKDVFLMKQRLYEFEEFAIEHGLKSFIRISNTDIVNFDYVEKLDMSLSGVITVIFKNNKKAIVSRRYMKKLSEELCLRK